MKEKGIMSTFDKELFGLLPYKANNEDVQLLSVSSILLLKEEFCIEKKELFEAIDRCLVLIRKKDISDKSYSLIKKAYDLLKVELGVDK
jgi:hypothetical protein